MSHGRRILLAALLLLGLAALAFWIFERQIAQMAFDRAVAQRMLADPSAELPDGLHAYLCGTGGPLPSVDRAGPCVGVLAGDQAFVFDVGAGSIRTLARSGFPVGRTETLYLTHLHSDHLDGIGELYLQAWVGGSRRTPLPVHGPPGTDEVVQGFNQVYRIDSTFRTAHHGPAVAAPSGYGGTATIIALPAGEDSLVVLDEDGLRITAFAVSHFPAEPAYGYRIDYGGRSLVISGDTSLDANLVAMAEDADLLIHDALNPDMIAAMSQIAGERGADALAKVFADILDYHASPEDAARAAQEAGVDALVLTHLVPPPPNRLVRTLFLGDARDLFDGDLRIGEDGLRISLPANDTAIDFERVF